MENFMKKLILLLIAGISIGLCQHSIPFASTNNTIELSVANTSTVNTSNVVVAVTSAPEWLNIGNRKLNIENLKAKETQTAAFTFSVDKSAPVNKPEQVTFTISNANGEKWTKTLSLQVSPPEKFELFQNYPNPFNPSTTISYQLPAAMTISLKIYDALGREVITLDEGVKEPGFHKNEWNARNIASGMYIYQLMLTSAEGKREFYRKKMLMVK